MKRIITVEVEDYDLSEAAIREAIVRNVADRILGITYRQSSDPETGEPFFQRDEGLLTQMKRDASLLVESHIKDVVETKVPAVVEEVLHGVYQPITKWGEKAGEPTTIRAMIGKHAEDWLNAKVDPSTGNDRGYNDNGRIARLHYLVKNEVENEFRKTIAVETNKIGAEVRAQMAGRISAAIAELVKKIVGE